VLSLDATLYQGLATIDSFEHVWECVMADEKEAVFVGLLLTFLIY
jgi:hypothetical protein